MATTRRYTSPPAALSALDVPILVLHADARRRPPPRRYLDDDHNCKTLTSARDRPIGRDSDKLDSDKLDSDKLNSDKLNSDTLDSD